MQLPCWRHGLSQTYTSTSDQPFLRSPSLLTFCPNRLMTYDYDFLRGISE